MTNLGMNATLFMAPPNNTPVWNEIKEVTNVSPTGTTKEANATTRASGGWEEMEPTIKSAGLQFTILNKDDDFETLRAAWANGTPLLWLTLTGPKVAGAKGVKFHGKVFEFQEQQGQEEVVSAQVTVKPTPSTYGPPAIYTEP